MLDTSAERHAAVAAGSEASKVGGKRFRVRHCYFVADDVVWVRPARLPYWPATVLSCDEAHNEVRARLLCPPSAALLEANLREEHARCARRQARSHRNQQPKEEHTDSTSNPREQATACAHCVSAETANVAPRADVVTSNAQRVYFFDKLATPHDVQECIEDRLQRRSHDVTAYEDAFVAAVHAANRLVRVVLSPEKLQPYEVCGVGVVHSLMRSHVAAPRQPHTGSFAPQTAVIRLRVGLENAVRDLEGFEYIWVLFQFSYAAAMATGEGQSALHRCAQHETSQPQQQQQTGNGGDDDDDEAANQVLSAWRHRQGVTRSSGFKVMLVPPRDEALRGVFATRSPHRPNFIGLSCVRLVAVHGLDVHIADHDLLHGTPVLDIKPYLPFCDAHPEAHAGWVAELDASGKGKGDHKHATQTTRVDRIVTDGSAADSLDHPQ